MVNQQDIVVPGVGWFIWDPDPGWWTGSVLLNDETQVAVILHPDEHGSPPLVQFVVEFLNDVREGLDRYKQAAADQLLEVFNTGWAQFDAEGPLSRDRFMSRLSLEQIEVDYGLVDAKGTLAWGSVVEFDADDMFTEHSVSVVRIWGKEGLLARLN